MPWMSEPTFKKRKRPTNATKQKYTENQKITKHKNVS